MVSRWPRIHAEWAKIRDRIPARFRSIEQFYKIETKGINTTYTLKPQSSRSMTLILLIMLYLLVLICC